MCIVISPLISLMNDQVLGCIKFLPPGPGGGGVYQACRGRISSCGKERDYHGCGVDFIVEKREQESNFISPVTLRLLGRISSREDGKRTEILEKKIKILKDCGGEEYQVVGNFLHPCDQVLGLKSAGISADYLGSAQKESNKVITNYKNIYL